MSTTEADNEELVRNYLQDITVEGNLDRLEEYISEDWVSHSAALPDTHGPDEAREFFAGMQTAFPDLDVDIHDVIVDGDEVTVRSTYRGTAENEFMGLPPTGDELEFGAVVIYRIADGKIVEEWHQADMLGVMEQLGVA